MKDQQVSGTHYAKLKIDPFTFAMENGWDSMMFSILKYLTRYKDKGTPLSDLDKAAHIAEYRKQFPKPTPKPVKITVEKYCAANCLDKDVRDILTLIEEMYVFDDVYFNQSMRSILSRIVNLRLRIVHDQEAVREKIASGQ